MNIDKLAEEMVEKHIFFNVRDIVRDDIYEDFDFDEDDEREICQLWATDYYLGGKLYGEGEAIIFYGHYCLWGRMTAGQAIWQDAVIRRIAEDSLPESDEA